MRDYFGEDYFFKDWKEQHKKRQEMMKRIDSIRNGYLRLFYPGLLESIKKDKKPMK